MNKSVKKLILFFLAITGLLIFLNNTKPTCSPTEPEEPVCVTPDDCEGLPHMMCEGEWQCVEGACKWECETACYQEGESFEFWDEGDPSQKCCDGLVAKIDAVWTGESCSAPNCPCYVCLKCGDGVCDKFENECNCPEDCKISQECEKPIDCIDKKWDIKCLGHWSCEKGKCVPVCDFDNCGDGVCDKDFGESEQSCPGDCGCAGEGEPVMPPYNCCEGLTPVSDCVPGEDCPISLKYCVDCGNGTCDEHENYLNCPQDCKKPDKCEDAGGECKAKCGPSEGEVDISCEGDSVCCVPGPCDDGTEWICDMEPPECPEGTILALQNFCWVCVNPETCTPPENECEQHGGMCFFIADLPLPDDEFSFCPEGYEEADYGCNGDAEICCVKKEECIGEGEFGAVVPDTPPCCPGLTQVSCAKPDENGVCEPCLGAFVCTKCGDGICGKGENICNCPDDCKNSGGKCNKPVDCIDEKWDIKCMGHWDCEEGKCVPVCDFKNCGDGFCDMEAGESFQSCSTDCKCYGEGESFVWNGVGEPDDFCCNGLDAIESVEESENFTCAYLDCACYVCVKGCGNGTCDKGENHCNCPEDCPVALDDIGKECADDSDCGYGLICMQMVIVPNGKKECQVYCNSDWDCPEGYYCFNPDGFVGGATNYCKPLEDIEEPLPTTQSDCNGDPYQNQNPDGEVNIKVKGSTIEIYHQNVVLNCCMKIQFYLEKQDNTLNVIEGIKDPYTPCFCECLFNLETKVSGLKPGTYKLVVWNADKSKIYYEDTVTIGEQSCYKTGEGFILNGEFTLDDVVCCDADAKPVQDKKYVNGECLLPKCLCYKCLKCGNGICDEGEDFCNCPSDCGEKCVAQGEEFTYFGSDPSVMCCDGLKPIPLMDYSDGTCSAPNCPCYICSDCGNGVCEEGENPCNCKVDCKE